MEGIIISFDFSIKETIGNIRLSRLRLGTLDISTPTYGLIHTDMNRLNIASDVLGCQTPFVPFHEVVIDKSNEEMRHFQFDQRDIELLRYQITKFAKKRYHNIFQLRIKPNVHLSGDQLKAIVEAQAKSERISVITLPDPYLRNYGTPWKKAMAEGLVHANEAQETGSTFTVMPVVSLDQPIKFIEAKIKWLLGQRINALGLRATGPFSPRLKHATELISIYHLPLWVHVWDLKKEYLTVSQIHLIPLNKVDTAATKKAYPRTVRPSVAQMTSGLGSAWPEPEGVPLEPQKTQQITFPPSTDLFEGRALGFLPLEECINEYGENIQCACAICQRARSMSELRRILSGREQKSLLQFHETVSSHVELKNIRDSANANELRDYYNSKTLVARHKRKLTLRFTF